MELETPSKANPTRFSWLRIFVVVIAIVVTLVAAAILGINHDHPLKQTICSMNIEAIEQAKQLWALENNKGDTDKASKNNLMPHLKNGIFPACPSGGTYTINSNNVRATCSVHTAATAAMP